MVKFFSLFDEIIKQFYILSCSRDTKFKHKLEIRKEMRKFEKHNVRLHINIIIIEQSIYLITEFVNRSNTKV